VWRAEKIASGGSGDNATAFLREGKAGLSTRPVRGSLRQGLEMRGDLMIKAEKGAAMGIKGKQMPDISKTKKNFSTDLPAHVIRARLDYDPVTGIFRWRVRPSNNMRIGAIAGCESTQGYVIRMFSENHYARRLAWLWVHDEIPDGHEVYGINGDRNDVRLANLAVRLAQERAVARPMLKPTQTGQKNISYSDQGFRVQLFRHGKPVHRSRHTTMDDAIGARDSFLKAEGIGK